MRPTLLNYRSPHQKTPEFYDVAMTNRGEALNFKHKSLNRKESRLSKAARFPNKGDYGEVLVDVSTSQIGPGKYEHQESYNKLVQRPCSSIMRKITVLPKSESGKPCYFMVG